MSRDRTRCITSIDVARNIRGESNNYFPAEPRNGVTARWKIDLLECAAEPTNDVGRTSVDLVSITKCSDSHDTTSGSVVAALR